MTFSFRIFSAVAFGALALPAALVAQEFDGVYEYAFCTGDPSMVALVIEGEAMSFYETPCTLTDPQPQDEPAGAISYFLSCDYGGASPQENRVVMSRDADGVVTMDNDGQTDRFLICD